MSNENFPIDAQQCESPGQGNGEAYPVESNQISKISLCNPLLTLMGVFSSSEIPAGFFKIFSSTTYKFFVVVPISPTAGSFVR